MKVQPVLHNLATLRKGETKYTIQSLKIKYTNQSFLLSTLGLLLLVSLSWDLVCDKTHSFQFLRHCQCIVTTSFYVNHIFLFQLLHNWKNCLSSHCHGRYDHTIVNNLFVLYMFSGFSDLIYQENHQMLFCNWLLLRISSI